ncbi:tRNA preQ1(34) S-adenosylmethionine ribosyltransferase-isomerase QueA [Gracilinema caldarium]|uniref:tRNA preQ1(34) S-adenosylmethionine ribosyltransferase-isomerase QueA n=1 Tax=Gracilinema caldarium TaxID=215591 RepID=UPI0026EE8FD6|nr:tRNA preQ1(34) S-adenosylmethionine ribosyltransferase-isomerase QueA [Gracilinema caldarium]
MDRTDFSFELPPELIAQHPPEERGKSRLMVLNRSTGKREHRMVADLPDLVPEGALMVFNDSRVRKARLFARAVDTGAEVEFLLTRFLGGCRWEAMVKRAKRRRAGSRYQFPDGTMAEIEGEDGDLRIIAFERPIDDAWLDTYGHIPLPPYIKRPDEAEDDQRYQTVYAKNTGSSAAPTAGLHFTEEILQRLDGRGIERVFVTLHVGLGTFMPVRADRIEDHVMHEETYSVSDETASAVERAKREKRPVIAVGTTSVRTLESAWEGDRLRRGDGATSIFIYPPYHFKVVDQLFTNFHTPESTLLMLVSAFAGREFILESYAEAVRDRYRFFSYGDAMYIQ